MQPVSAPLAVRGNRYISNVDEDVPLPFRRKQEAPGTLVSAGRALVYAGGLRYASTFVSMPFEVGKILLQIQWSPRPDVYARMERRVARRTAHEETQDVFESDEDFTDDDGNVRSTDFQSRLSCADLEQSSDSVPDSNKYFGDPTDPSRARTGSVTRRAHPVGRRRTIRRHSQRHRPSEVSVMPTTPTGGVWEMIKAVARGKEGVLGLFKGSLTTFLMDISSAILQPAVYGVLSLFVPGSRATVLPSSELFTSGVDLPLSYSPRPWRALSTVFLSHVVTGFLISPLDLVRTRLVAQSLVPSSNRGWWGGRKYVWPWDTLKTVRKEEGGWRGVYLHPNLLIPTLLDLTFRPLIALATPLVIDQYLRTEPGAAPVRYALAELFVSTLGLLVTLPVETVRRRLQAQTRLQPTHHRGGQHAPGLGPYLRLRTCVLTRPEPYAGVWDTIRQIVREESTPTPQPLGSKTKALAPGKDGDDVLAQAGYSSLGGLRNLYCGFSMGFGTNLLVFLLTVVSGERGGVGGWTEM